MRCFTRVYGRRGFVPALLMFAAGAAGMVWGQAAPDKEGQTVRVVVDYGDGVEKHFTRIPWHETMTVLDAMKTAAEHPRGIRVEYRGRGSLSLLIRIDDLKNEGSGRNWIYRVNGRLADRGVGTYPLKPGDTVLWKFEKYR